MRVVTYAAYQYDIFLYGWKDVEFEWRINKATFPEAGGQLVYDNPDPLAYCVIESLNDDIMQCKDWYTRKTTDSTYALNNELIVGCGTPSPIPQSMYILQIYITFYFMILKQTIMTAMKHIPVVLRIMELNNMIITRTLFQGR